MFCVGIKLHVQLVMSSQPILLINKFIYFISSIIKEHGCNDLTRKGHVSVRFCTHQTISIKSDTLYGFAYKPKRIW